MDIVSKFMVRRISDVRGREANATKNVSNIKAPHRYQNIPTIVGILRLASVRTRGVMSSAVGDVEQLNEGGVDTRI